MDRRSLIVGGGAAALAVAAGGIIQPAAASADGTTATTNHARRVLELVNVDRGLVDPDGARRHLAESLATYTASAPRDPDADDLNAWVRRRIASLTGTDSVEAAVYKIPETRELLAFGFLSYTQRQDRPQPKITRSMPVPAVLTNLEPDFLPELLRQVRGKAKASVPFASELRTSSDHLTNFITAEDTGTGPGHPTNEDIANWVVVLIVVAIVVISK